MTQRTALRLFHSPSRPTSIRLASFMSTPEGYRLRKRAAPTRKTSGRCLNGMWTPRKWHTLWSGWEEASAEEMQPVCSGDERTDHQERKIKKQYCAFCQLVQLLTTLFFPFFFALYSRLS